VSETNDTRTVEDVATVILWQNGMVMVFDRDGQQMPEFQGPEAEALAKLRAAGWTGEPERRAWPR